MEINGMVVPSCGGMGMKVAKPTIMHPKAGVGRFPRVRLRRGNVAKYYSATMFYFSVFQKHHGETIVWKGRCWYV